MSFSGELFVGNFDYYQLALQFFISLIVGWSFTSLLKRPWHHRSNNLIISVGCLLLWYLTRLYSPLFYGGGYLFGSYLYLLTRRKHRKPKANLRYVNSNDVDDDADDADDADDGDLEIDEYVDWDEEDEFNDF